MADYVTAAGNAFAWHELYVPNAEEAKSFYTEMLGFSALDYDMGPMGNYPMLISQESPIAGIMATSNNPDMANVPPHWSVYFAVSDVDASVAKCESLGGSLIVPAMDVPNVGRMALLRDPQGATFWVFKSANG